MIRICAVLLFLFPVQALAGAWSREPGSTFLSFSTTITSPVDNFGDDLAGTSSIYAERGMRRDLTFGIDAQMIDINSYSALVFIRRPVARALDPHRFAILAGAGVAVSGNETETILRLGAAWGRGISVRSLDGWAALDASVDYMNAQSDIAIKTDLTLGVKPNPKTKLMLQFQAGDYPGSDPYLRVAPSVAYQIDQARHLEFGLQVGLKNDDRVGVKLGTWLEF